MKTALIVIFVVLPLVGLAGGTVYYLYSKAEEVPLIYRTVGLQPASIVKKTVATGSIVPREEVAIKSQVSGVVESLHVQPGQKVRKNDLIARVRIIPNLVELNNAEARVRTARINLENLRREADRLKKLYDREVISEEEFLQSQDRATLAAEELETAETNLQLVREGASQKSGTQSNLIYSTVAGTVLEVPVKEGETVIEANSFNEGTSVATVADMSDLIFKGLVDESEVGKIREGMTLQIKVGAIDRVSFEGTLEYIAPKGFEQEGAVQFEVEASVQQKDSVVIRANYSANADIVLDRRDNVPALREAALQFEQRTPFVEVLVKESPQEFERREVELGLSDGINVEILGGLQEGEQVKIGRGIPAGSAPEPGA